MRTCAVIIIAVLACAMPAPAAAQPGSCGMFQVENALLDGRSSFFRVDLPSGATVHVAELNAQVNAIGYAAGQGLLYGMTSRGHVITIDHGGRLRDLGVLRDSGPIRVPSGGLAGAVAGTIAGMVWYLRQGGVLYTVDITPVSGSYLGILRAVKLGYGGDVDDFDLNPADGLLYGVSPALLGGGAIAGIDPATGQVRRMPARLPGGLSYGAVAVGPDRALYATNNGLLILRSRLFRIPLDGTGKVTELASRPAVANSDAAGCRTPPAPPGQQPPPPPPPPQQPVPPPGQQPVPPGTTPGPGSTTTTTAPPTTSQPGPGGPGGPGSAPTGQSGAVQRPPQESSTTAGQETAKKRRFALALLLIIIGATMVARATIIRRR